MALVLLVTAVACTNDQQQRLKKQLKARHPVDIIDIDFKEGPSGKDVIVDARCLNKYENSYDYSNLAQSIQMTVVEQLENEKLGQIKIIFHDIPTAAGLMAQVYSAGADSLRRLDDPDLGQGGRQK